MRTTAEIRAAISRNEHIDPDAALALCAIAEKQADEIERLRADAARYQFLRNRDLDTIHRGGVFAGMTPENVVINLEDLDEAVDAAMSAD
jgi:hypothetical protein